MTVGADLSSPGPGVVLHLPEIHCAGCIATVERTLTALPGVEGARVNLSLRRVAVEGRALAPETLIAALGAVGHTAAQLDPEPLVRAGEDLRDLLLRTGVAGFAMMNVMLLSVAVWSGADAATGRLLTLIAGLIAIPAVAFSGRPFFAPALRALRAGRLVMEVPISLAILLATGVSVLGAVTGAEQAAWFDAALALTFFLLVGRCLDQAGRRAARSAAAELAALDIPHAVLRTTEGTRTVRAATLVAGDLIEVRPGDRLPVDGLVESGASDLDRSALTGESRPAPVAVGGEVAAGEVNLSGLLVVRVVRAGRDTSLARLTDLVATAESQRSRWSGLADRAARIYAPAVHLLGLLGFVGWWAATGDGWRALHVAISVLVITCPCALGLAVPAVSTVATGRLFRRGLLVRSATALERLAGIDTVAFDKTGTLTTGAATLEDGAGDGDLALAAGLARGSSHPYSRAILGAALARGLAPVEVGDLVEEPGRGIEGRLAGRAVRLGHPASFGLDGEGVVLGGDGRDPVRLRFVEAIRPEVPALLAALRARGYAVALLSGDGPGAVDAVARRLGIAPALARLTPEDKAAWLAAQAAEGSKVLMVGDGLNDTAALAGADAAVVPASGLEAARAVADVVLVSGDLGGIGDLLETARQSLSRMRQNVAIAAGYNAVAIPLALLGLVTPLVAALAMSLSSLTVTANSVRGWR